MNRMRRVVPVVVGALVAAGLTALAGPPASAATVPAGFTDALVADVDNPTAIAFTADGRMLVTQQAGRLRVRTAAGQLLTTPALDLAGRICTNSERGLLGVAVDPDPATRAIYLYYTARTSSTCPSSQGANPAGAPVNRVSRFVLRDDNTVDPASERILLDGIYSPAGNHNAGDVHVGKDGFLYVSVGDGGCDYKGDSGCGGNNDASRDRNVLLGKIVRVDRTTGAPAPGNPFLGAGTASCRLGPAPAGSICQETFAWGLRNPFRFAFDPDAAGTVFHVNDVGQNAWEEIDLGTAGADYGWPVREGHCAQTGSTTNCGGPLPAGMTNPIHDYGRPTGCGSITGGAFVPNGAWPAAYDSAYLFADYVCGKIMMLVGGTRTDLATGLGGAVHLEFGPHAGSQALYYTTYANGGEIRRIAYTGTANRVPTAVVSASPATGAAPLVTTLDGSRSSDPDGGALTYLWAFGDGTPDATTTSPTVQHTYAAGTWTATLRVRDAAGATSTPVTVRISSGNTAPTVTMTSPAAGATFAVGSTVRLSGSATDAQDGSLPGTRLSWSVVRVHDQHTHPFLAPAPGNELTFVAPGPEDLAAAATSYLRVSLTATDSQGVTTTVTRDLQPRKVAVTLATSPAGRTLTVNGQTVTGPTTLTSWAGFDLRLGVPAQTDAQGVPYVLDRWSDGSTAADRVWTTPATAATLTATLRATTEQTGLLGTYFDNADLTGATVTRVDPGVDFRWLAAAPVAGIGADTFSVRWTGSVVPRYTQTYTFATTSDDGVRLWVDGRLIIDQWNRHAPRIDTGTIALTAGRAVPIRLEFFDDRLDATIQLRWSSPSQPSEIVPASRLRTR